MNRSLLQILRCPFCGSTLEPLSDHTLEEDGDRIITAILLCQCSAYPIVAGIPVLHGDYTAEQAMEQIGADNRNGALMTMLGLEDGQADQFARLIGGSVSYPEAVQILCPDAEGTYFVYRFSDPTYLAGQAIVQAISSDPRSVRKRAIDLCGGSGHLTRVMCQASASHADGQEVLLADSYFWKLWIAKKITAPECEPVCCDANNPLPFAAGSFSLAVCSDAFHYIWSKRLLSTEMIRLVGDDGIILLNHLHNSACENYSAGMPLSPEWWRNLMAELDPRLFKESLVLDGVINEEQIDLSPNYSDEQLKDEAALFLVATRLPGVFRKYKGGALGQAEMRLRINPLYVLEQTNGKVRLNLCFPSADYEEEFGACKRYLPEQVEIEAAKLESRDPADSDVNLLIQKRVLLDLPEGYL